MKNIYGKQIFISGVSSGIGKACALAFAKAGCHVIGAAVGCEEKIESYDNGGIFELQTWM